MDGEGCCEHVATCPSFLMHISQHSLPSHPSPLSPSFPSPPSLPSAPFLSSLSFLPFPSLPPLSPLPSPPPLSPPSLHSTRSAPNHHLLKAMARNGGGCGEYFDPKTKSKWQRKVQSQLSKAFQPALTSVCVQWQQFDEDAPRPMQVHTHARMNTHTRTH